MTTQLGGMRWPQVTADRRILLVPVGSVEQHGPHLPLDTDTQIAVALCVRAGAQRPGRVVVAPPVAFGASGEHADFPGTLSIGTEALQWVLVELGRSADAFAAVVFVNGHGGNNAALRAATVTLRSEGRDVQAWSWSIPDADAHAGRTETSLMLAIDPAAVDLAVSEPGCTAPLDEIFDDLLRHGVQAVSANGILGDPTGANAAEGEAHLAQVVAALVGVLDGIAD